MSTSTDVTAASPSGAPGSPHLSVSNVAAALAGHPPLRSAASAALAAGAGLIGATAAIHLHLYLTGYRFVPTLGVLFMLQAIAGFTIGAALLLGRHLAAAVAGAGYMAASAVGLILSATVGFVGVHDGLGTPWASTSLVVELVGFVLLGGTVVAWLYRLLYRGAAGPAR